MKYDSGMFWTGFMRFFQFYINPSLCPQYGSKDAGGVGHVPPGWDQWHALVSHERTHHSKTTSLLHSDQREKAVCAAICSILPLSDSVSHL